MNHHVLTPILLITCSLAVAEPDTDYDLPGNSAYPAETSTVPVENSEDLRERSGRATTYTAGFSAHSWNISAGQYQLDDANASREGIEDDAFYLRGTYQYQHNGLLIGGGVSTLVYDDNEEFTVRVENRWGYSSNRDSDATGYGLFAQLGYSLAIRPDRSLSVDFLAGYERLWSERSVSFCDDCPEEDIDVEGGSFAKASLRWIIKRPYTVSLNLKQFFSDSVDTGVGVTFGWTLY